MGQTYETELDHVQTHMLGLIVNIMSNYGLTEEHIAHQLKIAYGESNQYNAVYSDSNEDVIDPDTILDTSSVDSDTQIPVTPEAVKTAFTFKINSFSSSWASDDEDDIQDIKTVNYVAKMQDNGYTEDQIDYALSYTGDVGYTAHQNDKKMYVAHRRDFRDALSSGTKICSNYMDCTDDECVRFHVLSENLCPHAGRNNYCSESNCDKIVIKACRKGKRCNDSTCSFRH